MAGQGDDGRLDRKKGRATSTASRTTQDDGKQGNYGQVDGEQGDGEHQDGEQCSYGQGDGEHGDQDDYGQMMPGDGNNAGNGSATDGQGVAESTQDDAEQNRAIAG